MHVFTISKFEFILHASMQAIYLISPWVLHLVPNNIILDDGTCATAIIL